MGEDIWKLTQTVENRMKESFEIIHSFVGSSDDGNSIPADEIEKTAERLGVRFPKPFVEFYSIFGNNDKVMRSFFKFDRLEDIKILNDGIVFCRAPKIKRSFGIQIVDLEKENSHVSLLCDGNPKWYSASMFSTNFFVNMACWQAVKAMPNIAVVKIREDSLKNKIQAHLIPISSEKSIFLGFDFFSYYSSDNKILASYARDTGELYVASEDEAFLTRFESESGLKLIKEDSADIKQKPEPAVVSSDNYNHAELMQCFDTIKSFIVLEEPDGDNITDHDIDKTNDRLGIKLPQSLRAFYKTFGNSPRALNSYFQFEKLEDIKVEKETLIFCHDHQGQSDYGIVISDLDKANPPVKMLSGDEKKEWNSVSFLVNTACWQVINSMESMARVEIEAEDLKGKVGKYLNPISLNSSIFMGHDLISYHNSKMNILACYIRETEELYVASEGDRYLKKFESKSKLELDWL